MNRTNTPRIATKWQNVVAMGASPWNTNTQHDMSPEGTAGTSFHFAPWGLQRSHAITNHAITNHGLAPVATTSRPFGTESQIRMPCLVAEHNTQFGESAKLEQAIRANLRGLDYGG